jgi:hypothetical protein
MAATLPTFAFQVLDSNGDPISGAKLNCYAEGTTTPQTVYQDESLSTAHANPVVADGDGRFAPIYLQALAYKFVLTDASDNILQTIDNYNPDGGSVSISALTDATTSFVDDGDNTKEGKFQLSGVTTGNTRVLTWPNFDGTIATVDGTETPTNKTIDLGNNTLTGSKAEFNAALSDGTFYTVGDTDVAVADGGTGASTAAAAMNNLHPSRMKNVKDDYSAAGDGQRVFDGAISSSGTTLTSASNLFVSGDVGKSICIKGAAAAGADLITTIASFTGAGEVEVTASASTTVSSAEVQWGTDDTTALQNALDAGIPVYIPRGIYIVTGEIYWSDGSFLLGDGPFWKPRTGFVYNGSNSATLLFHGSLGASGSENCVARVSGKAVGVEGADFTATTGDPATDDLIPAKGWGFHIDANNRAYYGLYVYRAGNQTALGDITVERAVRADAIFLGCFTARFGHFGLYESDGLGGIIGLDDGFSPAWGAGEFSCFNMYASFHCLNNGAAGTFVEGDATYDEDGAGLLIGAARGSIIEINSEVNDGRAYIVDERPVASAAAGPLLVRAPYIEGNGAGPKIINYYDHTDGITIDGGYCHPGNGHVFNDAAGTSAGTTLTAASGPFVSGDTGKTIYIRGAGSGGALYTGTINTYTSATEVEVTPAFGATFTNGKAQFDHTNRSQDIVIEGITTDDGPADENQWLRFRNVHGDLFDIPIEIDSNTDKFVVEDNCDSRITFTDKSPANLSLVNRDIDFSENNVTMTKAELNSALSDHTLLEGQGASFTMTLVGETSAGTTGNTASANYYRVAQDMTIYFDGDYTSFDGTGNLKLTGLPESALTSSYFPIVDIRAEDSGATFDSIWGRTTAASTEITLWKKTIGSAIARLTDSDLDGSASNRNVRLSGTIQYRANV